MFFNDVEDDDSELDQYECFLQLSAQVMTKRGYNFYTVNTTREVRLRTQEGCDTPLVLPFLFKNLQKLIRVKTPSMFTKMVTKSNTTVFAILKHLFLGSWM